MMHLIHRNRVDHFADSPRNISPLRSPFPRGEGLFGASVLIDHPFLGALMSLAPRGKIFASKLDRSGSRNEQREFQ